MVFFIGGGGGWESVCERLKEKFVINLRLINRRSVWAFSGY